MAIAHHRGRNAKRAANSLYLQTHTKIKCTKTNHQTCVMLCFAVECVSRIAIICECLHVHQARQRRCVASPHIDFLSEINQTRSTANQYYAQ